VITIGKHSVGDGQKPFIIAEIGSNWRTFDDCKDSIAKAKACGADAVKFQAFTAEALYGVRAIDPAQTIEVFDHISVTDGALTVEEDYRGRLPLEWLPKLKAKADVCGIEFMCSAFSPELVAAVDPFVNVHKIASAELTHVRILEAVRKTGKPVILSTGASGERDIEQALTYLKGSPVILMYCVASYPARAVDLRAIEALRVRFGSPVGFSDHTTDVLEIPYRATSLYGACVIEKHVDFVGGDTPDHGHSLTCDQFMLMVKSIRSEHRITLGPVGEEQDMVLRHNRRLIATRDIQAGETFKEGKNFGIYRSLSDEHHAYSPFAISGVAGKPALRAVAAGCGIGPGDV
jgi:sialic acid synthase SpsE